jgi:hypothetical protein
MTVEQVQQSICARHIFQSSQIFVDMAADSLSRVPYNTLVHSKVDFQALPKNIRPVWKHLTETNILAYLCKVSVIHKIIL